MEPIHQKGDRYRVILHGIGENSEEERNRFCHEMSENYEIPASLLKKIVARCPIVIKKDLSVQKAEVLALTFKSFGASVSVERKRESPTLSLEFQGDALSPLALESSSLRRAPSGQWHLVGRVQNISHNDLLDVWVLVQLFDELGELITFEEASFPMNPLPSGESTPFRVILGKDFSFKEISILFKKASGQPILTMDRREKREWVAVRIPGIEEKEQPVLTSQPFTQSIPFSKPETSVQVEQESLVNTAEGLGRGSEEASIFNVEAESSDILEKHQGENIDLTLDFFEEEEQPKEQEVQAALREETAKREERLSNVLPEGAGERSQESQTDFFSKGEVVQELKVVPDIFKKEDQLLHPDGYQTGQREETLLYPWMEKFRESIERYRQRHQYPFTVWFRYLLEGGGFESPYHSLLTILTYARFNQDNHSSQTLGNTQKVFELVLKTAPLLKEIPPLEGTTFIQGEKWKELFFRAIPKIQEVANRILEKKKWDALDLDRLIRIIPHMSDRNSRWAIQSIGESIPEVFDIDFSHLSIHVERSLYRVASRLGIVNPFFDCYQGKNSMGDMKIQSFARAAFHGNPVKIEDPMTQIGTQQGEGHCLPSHPLCEGCPFNDFCPRLFIEIDPSEKGIIHR